MFVGCVDIPYSHYDSRAWRMRPRNIVNRRRWRSAQPRRVHGITLSDRARVRATYVFRDFISIASYRLRHKLQANCQCRCTRGYRNCFGSNGRLATLVDQQTRYTRMRHRRPLVPGLQRQRQTSTPSNCLLLVLPTTDLPEQVAFEDVLVEFQAWAF